MNKNKRILMIILGILAIVCIAVVILIFAMGMKNRAKEAVGGTIGEYSTEDTESILSYRKITYNGKSYTYNSDISTLLFMGVDQHNPVTSEGYEGTGGRSDCLILFLMNKADNSTKILEISRDTMTDIAIYDMDGEYAMNSKMQITMQYAYGDGGKKSCRLTKNAVSQLLYGIPIDSYLSMNIDGIKTITDAIGGVTLTIPTDYTEIDPAFQQGAMVTLDGAQAENYVRYRDSNATGSNDSRMERQMQYMKAIVAQLQNTSDGITTYQTLLDQASPYLVTDMDAESMYALAKYHLDEQEYKVPGETVAGMVNDEYNVDNKALQQLIVDLLYSEN